MQHVIFDLKIVILFLFIIYIFRYGFRKPPKMCVKAVPQVGDRPVVLSTISEWIENKLKLLLEKNLVVPNLDDVFVPILAGNALLEGPLNK